MADIYEMHVQLSSMISEMIPLPSEQNENHHKNDDSGEHNDVYVNVYTHVVCVHERVQNSLKIRRRRRHKRSNLEPVSSGAFAGMSKKRDCLRVTSPKTSVKRPCNRCTKEKLLLKNNKNISNNQLMKSREAIGKALVEWRKKNRHGCMMTMI